MGQPAKVGVVGWPIAHSRSPVIFGHWFERYGVDATYETIPVPPDEADAFFRTLPAKWRGVNVTVPYKELAARCVATDAGQKELGAVNTLWRAPGDEEAPVRGASSDGAGFCASLQAADPAWWADTFASRKDGREEAQVAVVLGAGGAAAAIVNALMGAADEIVVVNRTLSRAEALCERLTASSTEALTGPVRVRAEPWDALPNVLARADLLINATTLGMEGMGPLTIDLSPLPPAATVSDIVYTPLVTPLLAAADARGLRTVDGLGMLLHQATFGFEKWFGFAPEVDEALRARVEATL